ncbi:MAG: hypothetical protein K940chlam6_00808 [Chlamydiae bacterium]|nr:hypothetical protein [Chlamydiota bacterium]
MAYVLRLIKNFVNRGIELRSQIKYFLTTIPVQKIGERTTDAFHFLSDGELKDRTALTVRSDWEKAIHTAAFNDAYFTGELTYEKIIETLNKALDLNWEKGTQTKLEKPEPCRLVLH